MEINNLEWKARTHRLAQCEADLQNLDPRFAGEDYQTDTYFHTANGRLKLREGNVENALIYYKRDDIAGAKGSSGMLYPHNSGKGLREILITTLSIKVVVEKKRKIYYVDNVKIHFDDVQELGTFIEVEAINENGRFTREHLQKQCATFQELFKVEEKDFEKGSYSDMLLKLKAQ